MRLQFIAAFPFARIGSAFPVAKGQRILSVILRLKPTPDLLCLIHQTLEIDSFQRRSQAAKDEQVARSTTGYAAMPALLVLPLFTAGEALRNEQAKPDLAVPQIDLRSNPAPSSHRIMRNMMLLRSMANSSLKQLAPLLNLGVIRW
jgi:hypothetical protein